MSAWIVFEELANPEGRKTRRWRVRAKHKNVVLGYVAWYPAWRRYSYLANADTAYEEACLRDIATFCETATQHHKAQLKLEKARGHVSGKASS